MPTRSVIVIGASAGGLDALMRIVRDLPAEIPAAVLIVVHIPPRGETHLAEILAKISSLPVSSVFEAEQLQEGRIYVSVPDRHLVIDYDRVRTSMAPAENRNRPSVDVLFRSASIAYGNRAVGIILSGMLNDGTAGLRWIKRAGGMAIVQDPADAAFSAMPESAIAHVEVDAVLPAAEIAIAAARALGVEAALAEQRVVDSELVDDQGAPRSSTGPASDFVCPDCGGTLFALDSDRTLRYRCRVGHAYSPEGLHGIQERHLEESLWVAYRSLIEHADLSRRLARWANENGLSSAARRFDASALESDRKADAVRQAIVAGGALGRGEDAAG
jgi:two-component system chemotaxis response regulator CheB